MNPETTLMNRVRAACARFATLFRNNVGVAWRRDGVPIKFGLCRGSSDLIGWVPVQITERHVGATLALFVAIETKSARRITPEQVNFLTRLAEAGGISIVCIGENYAHGIISQAARGEEVWGRVHSEMPLPRRQTEFSVNN